MAWKAIEVSGTSGKLVQLTIHKRIAHQPEQGCHIFICALTENKIIPHLWCICIVCSSYRDLDVLRTLCQRATILICTDKASLAAFHRMNV